MKIRNSKDAILVSARSPHDVLYSPRISMENNNNDFFFQVFLVKISQWSIIQPLVFTLQGILHSLLNSHPEILGMHGF